MTDKRIEELLFALRRDFSISKEVVNALSKIGPEVIPQIVKAYTIDDFAFQLKLIELLSKLGELGFYGLLELYDQSNLSLKATILKTIKKMETYPSDATNKIVSELQRTLDWPEIEFQGEQELIDKIEDILTIRDNFVDILLNLDQLTVNSDKIRELAFLTFHIYLRKIKNQNILDDLRNCYSKVITSKKITMQEFENIYQELYSVDCRLREIIGYYFEDYTKEMDEASVEKIINLIGEKLARIIIKKNCDKKFYIYNYEPMKVSYVANHKFYLTNFDLFLNENLDDLSGIELIEKLKGIFDEIKRDQDYGTDEIYLKDIIGKVGGNETFWNDIETLDLSVKNLEAVNLQPLSNCLNLKFLTLSENNLRTVDLSPLMYCEQLDFLDLSNNKLTELDLSPLNNSVRMKWLDLSKNRLSTISLAPLGNNQQLIELKLSSNSLYKLDLSPLSNNKQLEEIDLTENQITTLDLSPLEKCEKLEIISVDESTILTWQKQSLPMKKNLPLGLQELYDRISN